MPSCSAVHAFLGRWTPDYLQGRDLWHFWFSRMVVPMVMLGVFAVRGAARSGGHHAGGGVAVRRHHFRHQAGVDGRALPGERPVPRGPVGASPALCASGITGCWARRSFPPRSSMPRACACAGGACQWRWSSWRFSPPTASNAVSKWIHANSWWIGVENLTFSQAESERMNGLCHASLFLDRGPSPEDLHRSRGGPGAGRAECARTSRCGRSRARARCLSHPRRSLVARSR